MKNFTQKITAIAALVVAAAIFSAPTVASAATVNDAARMFDGSFVTQLEKLEAERGLEVTVKTIPKTVEDVDAAAEAKKLTANNPDSLAVVLQEGTNKLGVSYGQRITRTIGTESLTKIVDREMIPLFEQGEYGKGVLQLVSSVNLFMDLEGTGPNTVEKQSWFERNRQLVSVLAAALVAFAAFSIFFVTKLSRQKAESFTDALARETLKRREQVTKFWDEQTAELKQRFISAENRVERETVMEESVGDKSFAENNSRLTNIVGSFMYPGKLVESLSILSFIELEEQTARNAEEAQRVWDSFSDEQRTAFGTASSETHQEALIAKFVPEANAVALAAQIRVQVPDAKSVNEDYQTYVDEKLQSAIEDDRRTGFMQKRKKKSQSGLEGSSHIDSGSSSGGSDGSGGGGGGE